MDSSQTQLWWIACWGSKINKRAQSTEICFKSNITVFFFRQFTFSYNTIDVNSFSIYLRVVLTEITSSHLSCVISCKTIAGIAGTFAECVNEK